MKRMNLTAVYVKVEEGFIGFWDELRGANIQVTTMDEVRSQS